MIPGRFHRIFVPRKKRVRKEPQGGFFHEYSCDLPRSTHPHVLRPGPGDPADHPAHRPGRRAGGADLRRPLRGRHRRRRGVLAGPPDGDAPRRPAGTLPALARRPPPPLPPAALLFRGQPGAGDLVLLRGRPARCFTAGQPRPVLYHALDEPLRRRRPARLGARDGLVPDLPRPVLPRGQRAAGRPALAGRPCHQRRALWRGPGRHHLQAALSGRAGGQRPLPQPHLPRGQHPQIRHHRLH